MGTAFWLRHSICKKLRGREPQALSQGLQDVTRAPGLPRSTGTQERAGPGPGALKAEDLILWALGSHGRVPSCQTGYELGTGDRTADCRIGLQVRRGPAAGGRTGTTEVTLLPPSHQGCCIERRKSWAAGAEGSVRLADGAGGCVLSSGRCPYAHTGASLFPDGLLLHAGSDHAHGEIQLQTLSWKWRRRKMKCCSSSPDSLRVPVPAWPKAGAMTWCSSLPYWAPQFPHHSD